MKIVCEVCGNIGYLQKLTRNYCRVRHYIGLDPSTKKPRFEYHKQSLDYVQRILNTKQDNQNIDLIDHNNHDQNLNNSSFFTENKGAGSLARLGHPLDVRKVTGSNPVRPTKTNKNVGMNLESTKCG